MNKRIIFSLIIFALLISSSVLAVENNLRQPNLFFEMRPGDEGFTGSGGMVHPLNNDENNLFYTDLRTMVNSGDVLEWNFGLGYRRLFENRGWILGSYIFRDFREQYGYGWNQWTLGGELLTETADFRLNLYHPIEDRILASEIAADEIFVSGNEVIYQQSNMNTYYETMGGYDLEVGKRFSENLPVDIGLYLRTFRFSSNGSETMAGNGIKIDTKFGKSDKTLWTFGFNWQEDNVRGTNFKTTLGVSIPIGKKSLENTKSNKSNLAARMIEAPKRDVDIIVGESKPEKKKISEEEALDPESGDSIVNAWYVTAEGEGDGSKDDPANLNQLFSEESSITLKENDIIILLGDGGEINTGDMGSLELYRGHKLLSPGGYLKLNSAADSSRSALFKPSGMQATLINSESNYIVVLADNTTVSGINFDGREYNNPAAVYGSNISGEINITSNVIDNVNNGIRINASSETNNKIRVNNNEIYTTDSDAVIIDSRAQNDSIVEVHDNYIKKAGGSGIFVYSRAMSQIFESSHVNITGNVIDYSNYAGISVDSRSETDSAVNIKDNVIKFVGSEMMSPGSLLIKRPSGAISVINRAQNNTTADISSNIIDYSSYAGINVDSFSETDSEVKISDNTIKFSGSEMGYANVNSMRVGMNGGTINVRNAAQDNIINNIKDNTINNSRSGGIYVSPDYFGGVPNSVLAEEAESETVNVETYITNNNIGTVVGEGIQVLLSYIPVESTQEINISNNNIDFAEKNGISVESGYYRSVVDDNIDKSTTVNINNNKINKAFSSGIAVFSRDGGNLDTIISENDILEAGYYGIALGANVYSYYYDSQPYYVPSSIDALVQNNSIESALNGGILIYTEIREDLEPPLESSVNIDEQILEDENSYGSEIDPIIDYKSNLYDPR